jgi:N-acetylglucosamine-6-sulfatase
LGHRTERRRQCRPLLAYLKSTGQLDRTVIVFMGDNGLLEGEHGMVDKRTMHEPSIRIPIIARGPGLPAGKVVPQQVLTLDIAPSLLGIVRRARGRKHSGSLLAQTR